MSLGLSSGIFIYFLVCCRGLSPLGDAGQYSRESSSHVHLAILKIQHLVSSLWGLLTFESGTAFGKIGLTTNRGSEWVVKYGGAVTGTKGFKGIKERLEGVGQIALGFCGAGNIGTSLCFLGGKLQVCQKFWPLAKDSGLTCYTVDFRPTN